MFTENPKDTFRIYDRKEKQWKWMKLSEIPRTYSMVPPPMDMYEEARLWLKNSHLVKHSFIWTKNRLSNEEFAKLMSETNVKNVKRYSVIDFF